MHRFFIYADSIRGNTVDIDEEQARHIEGVLRLKSGDFIKAFDGTGHEYTLRLEGRKKGRLTARIEQFSMRDDEPLLKLFLAQSIAKGNKMDTIIQKATELGISAVYPFISERTVVRLNIEKAVAKQKRWQTIAREACKQCNRNVVPEIKPVIDFSQLLAEIGNRPAIMLYENEEQVSLKHLLRGKKEKFRTNQMFLLVGPEGGFAPWEVEAAAKANVFIVKMGPRILRTETAGIAASSIIMYEYGDLG
ncbi:MAG: 16S rRNA (uracil(1498)-N(3))-methyltransferase [Syntrophomonadaceae bacterium]|nr:16S rRNA (uracil(1498)-N(3))-methyltransferase [Syntrophomonadaceae bacterium]